MASRTSSTASWLSSWLGAVLQFAGVLIVATCSWAFAKLQILTGGSR
jgi:hypothetical protein